MTKNSSLAVRELREEDVAPLTDYWMSAGDDFLTGMGVDLARMPTREEWENMLREQLRTPLEEKKSYCLIWLLAGEPIGHSNVNKIIFGQEAFMHLHLWRKAERQKGLGLTLVKMSLPYFFEKLLLKKIYCEPYALNPAPNKTLEKAGFTFVKTFRGIPGWLNFEQDVNLWELSLEKFRAMQEQ